MVSVLPSNEANVSDHETRIKVLKIRNQQT